jgi:hypothetical protein
MAPMELSATGLRAGQPQRPAPTESPPVPHRPAPAPRRSITDFGSSIGIERTAWFDLNGDGRIQNTSSMMGGDGYLIGDGDGDGRLATGRETWYDGQGRPVPPPPPGRGEVPATPPAAAVPRNEQRARAAAAAAYSGN